MKTIYKTLALFSFFNIMCGNAWAAIKLPSFITDNMVVQCNSKLTLTGVTETGKDVEIIPGWDNKTYRGKTDDKGKFTIIISTPEAGGPYDLTVRSGNEKRHFTIYFPEKCGYAPDNQIWNFR